MTRVRYALILLCLALLPLAAVARQSGLKPTRVVLDNGMVVILQEQHSMPLVSVNIFVKAGGMYETPENNGISHFYEHLFFRGTKKRTGAQIKRDIEALGGRTNAQTSKDFTQYYINLPSVHAKEGIDILADSLLNSDFEQGVDTERQAVLDEYRIGLETPGQVMQQALFSQAFTTHTYRMSVIGTEANIRKLNTKDFIDFKKRFYVPERTAVVIVGDFKTGEMLDYIKTTFKDFKSTGLPVPTPAPEPPLKEIREVVQERDLRNAYVVFGYHAPSVRDRPDIYAVDVLTFMLGQGRGSILRKALIDEKKLAVETSADFLTQRDRGLFIVSAGVSPGRVGTARSAVLDVLEKVRTGQFSDEDFNRAKNLLISTYIIGNQTNSGKAEGLGFYEMIDEADFALTYLDGVEKVTRQDVIAAANKYLGQPYTYVLLRPHQRGGR